MDAEQLAGAVLDLVRRAHCVQCLIWAKSDALVRPQKHFPRGGDGLAANNGAGRGAGVGRCPGFCAAAAALPHPYEALPLPLPLLPPHPPPGAPHQGAVPAAGGGVYSGGGD